jgi:hypothetical protein
MHCNTTLGYNGSDYESDREKGGRMAGNGRTQKETWHNFSTVYATMELEYRSDISRAQNQYNKSIRTLNFAFSDKIAVV